MWMMVLNVRQEHAENIHYLLQIQIPKSVHGSVDTPKIGPVIGPVIEVKTTCRLDQYGIEIQVPSASGDGSTSWVVLSRGSKRHVAEVQIHDPAYSPESHELANTSVGKPPAAYQQAQREKLVRHSRKHNQIR